jgi:hypothetical protein
MSRAADRAAPSIWSGGQQERGILRRVCELWRPGLQRLRTCRGSECESSEDKSDNTTELLYHESSSHNWITSGGVGMVGLAMTGHFG